MMRSCKRPAASQTMLDSIRKGECGETSRAMATIHKGGNKMGTTSFPTQAANQAKIYEDIFNRQKAYFASNITKSFEWRLDQLDRLARMLSEHANEFYEGLSRDFK